MTTEMVKKHIFKIFDESGIYVIPSEMDKDLDLREYIIDSLQFVYFIIELESCLEIELPDEILEYDNLASINGFANMVAKLCDNIECELMSMNNE